MTDKRIQNARGRLKEAAGSLSGDRALKSRGMADQAAASAKDAIDKLAEGAKRLLAERKR
ncbi:MAG: CsbD family protein [Solirubrobacterales bacterium]|nr:MAG: CsbD family protein [Solirubrobacterales bacterium]